MSAAPARTVPLPQLCGSLTAWHAKAFPVWQSYVAGDIDQWTMEQAITVSEFADVEPPVGPLGQHFTDLLDATGYLASVSDPASDTYVRDFVNQWYSAWAGIESGCAQYVH